MGRPNYSGAFLSLYNRAFESAFDQALVQSSGLRFGDSFNLFLKLVNMAMI